jgi:hypothetical protein
MEQLDKNQLLGDVNTIKIMIKYIHLFYRKGLEGGVED